jgi:ABC-type polysaccharide/polyol phosphate export permease
MSLGWVLRSPLSAGHWINLKRFRHACAMDDIKARPRRGAAWAYMVGSPVVTLFMWGFVFGLLGKNPADSGVSPVTVALVGTALGWFAYRIFSKPKQQPRPPDQMA